MKSNLIGFIITLVSSHPTYQNPVRIVTTSSITYSCWIYTESNLLQKSWAMTEFGTCNKVVTVDTCTAIPTTVLVEIDLFMYQSHMNN